MASGDRPVTAGAGARRGLAKPKGAPPPPSLSIRQALGQVLPRCRGANVPEPQHQHSAIIEVEDEEAEVAKIWAGRSNPPPAALGPTSQEDGARPPSELRRPPSVARKVGRSVCGSARPPSSARSTRPPSSARSPSPPRFMRGKSPQDDLNLEDRPDTAQEGHLAIESILNWPMQPLAHRGEPGQAAVGGLSRLSVEIDQLSQEWAAYQSGHLHRGEALAAAAGEGPPPLDPWRTARAASLLVRVVRHFSEGLPLRRLLEPLTQELLEAVYRDWQATESLSALDGASLEAFLEKPTHYAVLRGHLEITREARERAAKAEVEAEAHRQRAAPREEELEEERRKAAALVGKPGWEDAGGHLPGNESAKSRAACRLSSCCGGVGMVSTAVPCSCHGVPFLLPARIDSLYTASQVCACVAV